MCLVYGELIWGYSEVTVLQVLYGVFLWHPTLMSGWNACKSKALIVIHISSLVLVGVFVDWRMNFDSVGT